MAVEAAKRLFTVDEYYRMAEAGILGEDDRVELIEGEIVEMNPIGPLHSFKTNHLTRLFINRLGIDTWVRIQDPVRLSRRSEPQPDIAVVRLPSPPARDYRSAHPAAADIYLLVEVADTSLGYDIGAKAALYGRHGVAELWVVDLTGEQLYVFRNPTARGYGTQVVLRRGESVSPIELPQAGFTVDELLA